jgi:hypothetical protein
MKLFALLFLGLVTLSALAEDVYVKQPAASIRAGKGAAYDEVAKLKKGDKMTVIAREGKWIFETTVSDQKPGENMFSALGSSAAGSASAAEAGRGVGESLDYAKAKGLNTTGLEKMMSMRNLVKGPEQEAFEKDGKVGVGKM